MDYSKDFSKETRKMLRRNGISVIGIQMIPSDQGWINPEKAYVLDDNGTAKVSSHKQIRELNI